MKFSGTIWYHLQFDAAEVCQSRPLELSDYYEKTTKAEPVVMKMIFRSILTRSLLGQTMREISVGFVYFMNNCITFVLKK